MSLPKRRYIALLCVASARLALPANSEQLSGAANFRDIGGYRTSDGYKIKQQVVFRSGELSGLTEADRRALQALHIRYEIDLRTEQERAQAPSKWGQRAPKVISISVAETRDSNPTRFAIDNAAQLRDPALAAKFMEQATARIAIQGAGDIGEVLRDIAKGDEPALIHCTAGKDRTGVTIAVLMTLLQVPRDQVYSEYTKSNQAIEQQLERAKMRERDTAPSGLLALPAEVLRKMMGAEQSYLEAAFKSIDTEYGSFEGYTRNGLKITAEQIRALRARLLER